MIGADRFTPESAPLAANTSAVQIFAVLAVVAVIGSALYLLLDAVRGDHGHPFLEANASIMFAGWFSAAVGLQLAGTPWTSGGVVTLPWLIVCSLLAASLALIVVGVRLGRTSHAQSPLEGSNDDV